MTLKDSLPLWWNSGHRKTIKGWALEERQKEQVMSKCCLQGHHYTAGKRCSSAGERLSSSSEVWGFILSTLQEPGGGTSIS